MHEASIALSLIEIAEKHCIDAGFSRIDLIEATVGSASGVMAEALMSAFEIVRLGTRAEGAQLLITRVPLGGLCRCCGSDFDTEEAFILACPLCGGQDFTIERGRELHISQIEVN